MMIDWYYSSDLPIRQQQQIMVSMVVVLTMMQMCRVYNGDTEVKKVHDDRSR
jgi:hypothetical protein